MHYDPKTLPELEDEQPTQRAEAARECHDKSAQNARHPAANHLEEEEEKHFIFKLGLGKRGGGGCVVLRDLGGPVG